MDDTAVIDTPALFDGCVDVALKLERMRSADGKARRSRLALVGEFCFDAATYRMVCPEGWWARLWKLSSYSFEYGLAEGRFVLDLHNLALDGRHLAAALPVDQPIEVTQTVSTAHERATEGQRGQTADLTAAAAPAGKFGRSYSEKTAAKANDGHQFVIKRSDAKVTVYAGGTTEAPAWRFATAAPVDAGRAILAGRWQGTLAEFTVDTGGRRTAVNGRFHARQQDIIITRVHDDINCADLSGPKRTAIQAAFLKEVRDRLAGNHPLVKAEASHGPR